MFDIYINIAAGFMLALFAICIILIIKEMIKDICNT